jgi:murein DD-endopeptidase MepM/ murein hydrolase activator NlpD
MRRTAVLAALVVSACASEQAAPISYGSNAAAPVQPARRAAPIEIQGPQRGAQSAPEQAPPTSSTQQPDWAAGPGTPLSAYALQPSPYDPAHLPATHRVEAGQSLYDIATLYQLPLRALIDENHLQPPYALPPGTIIRLPPPHIHVVAQGESFENVARQYNVDLRSLALLNRMQSPYAVRAGDRIVLPAMAREDDATTPPASPAIAASPTIPMPDATTAPAPSVQGGGRFAWPLRGEIVAHFGAQANGARLDGVEIAGHEGDPIAAAADGDVVYAGSDLASYGTLVLVRHAGNYVTAYGFARRALVREGQHVRAGEPIAELGSRPDGRARLLFQVRQGTQAVDPAPLLRGPAN